METRGKHDQRKRSISMEESRFTLEEYAQIEHAFSLSLRGEEEELRSAMIERRAWMGKDM